MSKNFSLEQAFESFNRKEYRLAETIFRDALNLHGGQNTEINFHLAFCMEMQGRYDEAESIYLQACSSNGPRGIVGNSLYRIAWMSMILNDHSKAITYYKKAAELLRDSPGSQKIYRDSIYWMALCHEVMGQVIKALEIYELITTDDFWFWDVCNRKILCLDRIGRYEDAMASCREFEERFRSGSKIKRAKELYPSVKGIKDQLEKLLAGNEK